MLEGAIASLKIAMTLVAGLIPTDPLAGKIAVTLGGVVSSA